MYTSVTHYCNQDTENSLHPQKCPHATLKTIPSLYNHWSVFLVIMDYFAFSKSLCKRDHQHLPFFPSTLINIMLLRFVHVVILLKVCFFLLWSSISLHEYTIVCYYMLLLQGNWTASSFEAKVIICFHFIEWISRKGLLGHM